MNCGGGGGGGGATGFPPHPADRATRVRVSLVGIDLITIEARLVVASIDTYLKYSDAVGAAASAARPTTGSHGSARLAPQNDDNDDDDGGTGSSGARAMLRVEIRPRRRPPGAPPRTSRH